MNDIVSIVVPVYGAENDLGKLIDSILAQTYKNLQILLVDDESPDRCGEICDEYAARDERIQVIHKKNGGVSTARNVGIDNLKGKYVCFVDDDDRLEEQYVEKMYNAMEKTNAGICMCAFRNKRLDPAYEVSGDVVNLHTDGYVITKEKNSREFYKFFALIEDSFFTLNKMYRVSVIRDHDIRFRLGMKTHEDHLFENEYIPFVQDGVVISDPLYVYAASETSFSDKEPFMSLASTDAKMVEYLKQLRDRVTEKEHIKALNYKLFWFSVDVLYGNKRFKDGMDVSEYRSIVRKHFFECMFSTRLSIKFKGTCIIKLFVPGLYSKLRVSYHKKK